MRLASAFIRLPLAFDAHRLAQEALQFPESEWTYHPLRHNGNTALPLVSANGEVNDRYDGEMLPTAALAKCPYIRQVMAAFHTVVGRSRLMRLAAGADVPSHSDGNYLWRDHVRIHVPIITHPDILFSSINNIDVNMAAGEAWTFDNWRQHAVFNSTDVDRIHLVIDTVGTSKFWETVAAGQDPACQKEGWGDVVEFHPFRPDDTAPAISFERFNSLSVRAPDEIENMLAELLDDLLQFRSSAPETYAAVGQAFRHFHQDWRSYWALYGDTVAGIPHYERLVKQLKIEVRPLLEGIAFDSNEADAFEVTSGWLSSATDVSLAASGNHVDVKTAVGPIPAGSSGPTLDEYMESNNVPRFDRPVFIVAAPRSGSTMLFEALQRNKGFWSIGDESHREIESIPDLHPARHEYESNSLTAGDYTPQVGALLMDAFMSRLQNAGGGTYLQTPSEYRPPEVRFLEKTPKNALRIPFFRQMFPDALFIFLSRRPEPNIGSIVDAWKSQKFVTYPNLPQWDRPGWSLLLPPGWRKLRARPLAEIAAWQWAKTNEIVLDELAAIPAENWAHVRYESLLAEPERELKRLCAFADVPYGPRMESLAKQGFPRSRYTLSAPDTEKWRRHEKDIKAATERYEEVAAKLRALD